MQVNAFKSSLCPICVSKEQPRHWGQRWGFEIIRCPSCGVGITALPAGFDPSAIYSEDYFRGVRSDGYADYVGSSQVIRSEAVRLIDGLTQFGARGGKLLDVGCAYGFFLDVARQHFDVAGIEICDAAARSCRDRGLDVSTGVVTQAYLRSRGPFDVAVLLDVIEHLPDPYRVLHMLHEGMVTGGRLMVTTGDWGSLMARLAGTRWRLLTPPQHLFYFHEESLRLLLRRSGFRVLQVVRPAKQVSLGLIAYQLQRLIGMKPRPLHRLSRMAIPVNLFDAMRVIAVRA